MFRFEPDVGESVSRGGKTWKFVSVSVRNKKRPWICHFLDETAHLCTAQVEFLDSDRGNFLIDPMDARWPRFQAEPIDPKTGALNVGAILIPHRETIPPGDSASINVAVKFEGDLQCYGFNNRSYGFQDEGQWRYSKQRLDSTSAYVGIVISFEGKEYRSPDFVLDNPDSSVASFTLGPSLS